MKKAIVVALLSLVSTIAQGKMYYCIDSEGQRVFSDMPCDATNVGEGVVSSYEGGTLSVKYVPVVLDEQTANKIRYRLTPAQAKERYCAKYTPAQRGHLIQTGQVVLGMYLADVIKVWGAPLANDGNRVLFQDGDDTVAISLLEGCVINIERDYMDEEEFFNPSDANNAIDNNLNY